MLQTVEVTSFLNMNLHPFQLQSLMDQSRVFCKVPLVRGFSGSSDSKESKYNAGDLGLGIPWIGKIPWGREWLPTHSILAWIIPWTWSLWGHKESNRTERLNTR